VKDDHDNIVVNNCQPNPLQRDFEGLQRGNPHSKETGEPTTSNTTQHKKRRIDDPKEQAQEEHQEIEEAKPSPDTQELEEDINLEAMRPWLTNKNQTKALLVKALSLS
jgi:hypothetical protein